MKVTIFAIVLGVFILFCVACAFSKVNPEKLDVEPNRRKDPTYHSGADWYLDPIQYMNPQRWNLAGTKEGFKIGGKTVGEISAIGGVTLSDNTFGYCDPSNIIVKTDAAGSNCPTVNAPTAEGSTADVPLAGDTEAEEVELIKEAEALGAEKEILAQESHVPPRTYWKNLSTAPAPSNADVDALASAKLLNFLSQTSSTTPTLPTILTEWMAKNAPKPEEAPYQALAPSNQCPYLSAYQPQQPHAQSPLPDYRGEYPKDEPVQTSPSEMKPGISSYNTSTVFIPPPIGGGQPKNTGSNMNSCPEPAPCPACARCPEPSFDCKKVPNYSSTNSEYLPMPVLNDFSTFGM